nr:unnamed protein product [Callosobruchus analis]
MWKSIEIFYILTVCNVCVTSEGDSKLLSFVQLFRHGARTPILFYKDDPYKDSSHWDGIEEGQLTKEGKQQLVELGQYIRHRYADFLPKTYNDKFFKVTSVSSRRNLESMEKFLEGLYPDLADPKSAIKVEDVVLRAFLYPTYILQYFKLVATNKELRSFIDENKDIFRYLREKAKIGKPIPEGLFNSYVVYDILSIEAGRNLTLPEWTKSVFPEMITVMAKTFSKTMCYNEEMQKTGKFSCPLLSYCVFCSPAIADLSVCPNLQALLCSVILVFKERLVVPTYTIPHEHGISYTPADVFGTLLSFAYLSKFLIFCVGLKTIFI